MKSANSSYCQINVERYLREADVIYQDVCEALIASSLQPQLSWIRVGKVHNILAYKDQLWTFQRDPSLPIHSTEQSKTRVAPVSHPPVAPVSQLFLGLRAKAHPSQDENRSSR